MTETFIPSFMEVLTDDGWRALDKYTVNEGIILYDRELNRMINTLPDSLSSYTYNGPLVKVDTNNGVFFFKPSNKVLSSEIIKAKSLTRDDKLMRYYLHSTVENVSEGLWSGLVVSLKFSTSYLIPIRFEEGNDYCFITS